MKRSRFGLILLIGLFLHINKFTGASVPCIDKTTSCNPGLCGSFITITYDVCRKTCNSCDGPILDLASGNFVTEKATVKTTITSTTSTTSTTTTTPRPTTTTPRPTTTTPRPTTTTSRPTTTPTTTTTTTSKPTTTTTTRKPTTMKTTQQMTVKTTQSVVCADKISSCNVNAKTVCGNDYHFTYDLCRKTCGQCNGPAYTTNTPLIFTTTSGSDISNKYKEIECYHAGHSQQYDGRISVTSTNHTCVNWASVVFLNGYKASQFPDGDYNHNFCRDPSNTGEPYCHTLYGKESCGIMKCPGQCVDSATVSCSQFGESACKDDEFARTICPLTCKKCGYGIIIEGSS